LRYEPEPRGLPAARVAVALHFVGRGFEVDSSHMHLTASTSEAYAYLLKLLCDAGDTILVPRPSYPLVEYLAALEYVELLPYDLRLARGRWEIDFASLEAACLESTRAVVLVNPNNPTGSVLNRQEMDTLVRFCAERELALISDEVFYDYALEDSDQLPADRDDYVSALAAGNEALVFTLGGFSKMLALPQLKLGWIITNGPDSLVNAALERLDLIADTYLSVNTPVQHAAAQLLPLADALQEPILRRCARNLSTLRSLIAFRSDCTVAPVMAGWYAILSLQQEVAEEDLVYELLEATNVLVHPGFFFDFVEGSHLVLSLLAPEETFREGVGRVLAYLETKGS
jgi:aspartate/methionine/tyrosine aminotransferase